MPFEKIGFPVVTPKKNFIDVIWHVYPLRRYRFGVTTIGLCVGVVEAPETIPFKNVTFTITHPGFNGSHTRVAITFKERMEHLLRPDKICMYAKYAICSAALLNQITLCHKTSFQARFLMVKRARTGIDISC